jgi:DNA-binding response OmpR family regulator
VGIRKEQMNTRKKILIVDDEQLNLEFFEVMLSKLGFAVEEASDGVEAIDKVKHFYPDLILLDNIMPRMSGWEVTKTLKNDPKYRDIPIVMFSALDDVKDKLEGYQLGVEDYITKPFNFSEVLARIQVVLRNREIFAQIALRESRLNLADTLKGEVKAVLPGFIKSIDELDSAVSACPDQSNLGALREKTVSLRRHIAELDARIERVSREWEELKKNEVSLAELETQYRSYTEQE